jgi:hypothetical protein
MTRKKRTTLPRVEDRYGQAMFLRPVDPDNHDEFTALLPSCTPLFVYDSGGRDWVRWSIPKRVVKKWGFGGGCACCHAKPVVETGNVVHMDTARDEVQWYLDAAGWLVQEAA